LTYDGASVHIQARAFEALVLLVRKRNEVVSKAELLSTIWPDIHVEESSLPVMISAIRRAIGDDGRNQKYIQTISKFGYRFVGEVAEISTAEPAPPAAHGPDLNDPAVSPALSAQPLEGLPFRTRYARFLVVAGSVTAALAAVFILFRSNIGTGEGHVAAASQVAPSSRAVAEEWYQKGHYAWNLQTKDGFLQSIEYYQKAITADPDFAPAYAGLAKSYVILPSYSQRPDDQLLNRARAAAAKAVRMDDRLEDAHIALGMVFLIGDRDLVKAEREFREAIALDSHSSLAEGQLAKCLIAGGRTDEGIAHARLAKALDPLSVRAATDLGIALYFGHRFTEAASEFEEVLKLDPYYFRAANHLGKVYLSLGRFNDARRVLAEASILPNHDPALDGLMVEAKAMGGDIEGAKSVLAALEQRAKTTYVSPINIAFAMVGLGRLDDALAYLRKACDDRTIDAIFLRVDPSWEPLHGNPDFRKLVGLATPGTDGSLNGLSSIGSGRSYGPATRATNSKPLN
jgi:DNA-binding winged helix-turn-helix (wHTH) protein/tetratricopeptide (TPR) repeat protein